MKVKNRYGISSNKNNNIIVGYIVKDIRLQDTIQQNNILTNNKIVLQQDIHNLRKDYDKLEEQYKLEQILVKAIQEYLVSLEEDYKKIIIESNNTI